MISQARDTGKASVDLPESLEEDIVDGLPDNAFYISNFITEAEEEAILDRINTRPLKSWKQLSRRRLQVFPSALSEQNEVAAGPLPSWLENPVISRLLTIPLYSSKAQSTATVQIPGTGDTHIFSFSPHRRPNHALVNEYPPAVGISPHTDGPAYHPIVATVSFGSHTVLDIYEKNTRTGGNPRQPKWRLLQESRSLLVTTSSLYQETLHGIAEVSVDEDLNRESVANWHLLREETRKACEAGNGRLERGLRVSVTLRDVLKVRDWSRLIPSLKAKT